MSLIDESIFYDSDEHFTLKVRKHKDGVALRIIEPWLKTEETILLDASEFTRLVFYLKGLWEEKYH